MILVQVNGGLGNQMFQYAMGRALARRLGRPLVLDAFAMPSGQRPHLRRLSINQLSLSPAVRVAGAPRGSASKLLRKRPILGLASHMLNRGLRPWCVDELDPEELTPLYDIPQWFAYLRGYWQSPHYFADMAATVRSELFPPMRGPARFMKLLESLSNRDSIAVHVRRGDYVDVMSSHQTHGVVGAAFFQSAVGQILRSVETDAVVAILSDDPLWAAANLRFDAETVHVEIPTPLTDLESLAVMARCQHHVISNSSFSWWGAWLAEHDTQQVYYPKPWFAKTSVNPNFRFPSHWSSLPLTD